MTIPTLELDAGFESGAPYAYYNVALYDDGSQYAPDFISHDITAYGRDAGFTINRGVSSIVTTGFGAQAGTGSWMLENTDRRFDPNHLTGPYVVNGVSVVVPGVPIVKKATYNAVTYTLFSGTADEWPQQYPMYGTDQTIPLRATDATQLFANANLSFARPAEYSGARIAAVASECGWNGPTAISHGNTIVGPLTLGTISAWSHMTDVANAEWGDLYISKNGTLTFRSRDLILSESRSLTSQGTFGDQGVELRYTDIQMGSPPIVNECIITYNDRGSQVSARDQASQAQPWGKRSLTLAIPIYESEVALQYAHWIVQRFAYPLNVFQSITLKPARDPANQWPHALGRELGDRITVKRTPQGGGSRLSADCFIRGIVHNYSSHDWSTTFILQDASWTTVLARYDISTYNGGDVYSL